MISRKTNDDFMKYLHQPLPDWDLLEGALLIARQEYPKLKSEKYLSAIREMTRELGEHLDGASSREEKLERYNQFFFEEMGFKGNREDYYDPRNSYVSDVMERKTGIPIALSALYLHLGWKLCLPLFGINFPGHFLVDWKEGENHLYIDVFNEGQVLGTLELEALFKRSQGDKSYLQPAVHLRNAGVTDILHRMLANLKGLHASKGQIERALWAAEWMFLLKSNDWESLRDKGIFCYSLGRMEEAQPFLEEYLKNVGRAPDYSQVWQILQAIQAHNPIRFN
jgi:regulator of sirC expression with transglutaminase-like and TPR domain